MKLFSNWRRVISNYSVCVVLVYFISNQVQYYFFTKSNVHINKYRFRHLSQYSHFQNLFLSSQFFMNLFFFYLENHHLELNLEKSSEFCFIIMNSQISFLFFNSIYPLYSIHFPIIHFQFSLYKIVHFSIFRPQIKKPACRLQSKHP